MEIWWQSSTVIHRLHDYRNTLSAHLDIVRRPHTEIHISGVDDGWMNPHHGDRASAESQRFCGALGLGGDAVRLKTTQAMAELGRSIGLDASQRLLYQRLNTSPCRNGCSSKISATNLSSVLDDARLSRKQVRGHAGPQDHF
jgi:hypothetical protein